MRRFRVGSAFGIPIQLDLTFLVILPVFAAAIAFQVEVWVDLFVRFGGAQIEADPLSRGLVPWLLGALGAIGLFAGILLHELGHSVVALRYDFSIQSITLWLFGGVARFEEMPEDWRTELSIAVAGPAVSVVVGVVAALAFLVAPVGDGLVAGASLFLLGYLAVMNVGLAAFNMIPGFPMDGGRVLRAVLARSRPYPEATRQAAGVGKVVAVALALVGILIFNPLLLALAGFLYVAAAGEAREVAVREALEDVPVWEVMTPAAEVDVVNGRTSVAALLDRMFEDRTTWYPVARGDEIVGVVELGDARGLARSERETVTVAAVMQRDPPSVDPDTDLADLVTSGRPRDRLLVLEDGQFLGVLRDSDVEAARGMVETPEAGRSRSPDDGL